MAQAWLDSLSEDWVSQPRSPDSLPSLPSNRSSIAQQHSSSERVPHASRIPLFTKSSRNSISGAPLSERSQNDTNIASARTAARRESKLRDGLIGGESVVVRGRRESRVSLESNALNQSVQRHSTVEVKAHSSSPHKSRGTGGGDTPEWRRRLLNGDVGYGEQCDLFGPSGLENIFKPPAPDQTSPAKSLFGRSDSVMPSSPPIYRPYAFGSFRGFEAEVEEFEEQVNLEEGSQRRREPRQPRYRLQRSSSDPLSEMGSEGHNFLSNPHIPLSDILRQRSKSPIEAAGEANPTDRTVSGGSAAQHENFTPITLSRLNTVSETNAAVAEALNAARLEQRLEALNLAEVPLSEDGSEGMARKPLGSSVNIPDVGQFVNMKRGGRSRDGSFRHRLLSLSSLAPINESNSNERRERGSSLDIPNISVFEPVTEEEVEDEDENALEGESEIPAAPQTPNRGKLDNADAKSSGGSPLKLFGDYDTFTDAKLRRRLSQFEMAQDDDEGEGGDDVFAASSNAIRIRRTNSTKPSIHDSTRESISPPHYLNKFGEGQLEGYRFSDNLSLPTDMDAGLYSDVTETPASRSEDDGSCIIFHLDPSSDHASNSDGNSFRSRRKSSGLRATTPKRTTHRASGQSINEPVPQPSETLETPRKTYGDAMKRLERSPFKTQTPKRRRTLHKSDVAHRRMASDVAENIKEKHTQMQSIIGRKRKDARYDDSEKVANPDVIAQRQILKPRSSSNNRRSSSVRRSISMSGTDASLNEQALNDRDLIQAQVEPDTPNSNFDIEQPSPNDSNRGSFTTQDFLDEAKMIMANIRSKARSQPHSALASINESESDRPDGERYDPADLQDGESSWASSVEPLSRPPSREGGGPMARLPRMQSDPKILDHLKKYEEVGDIDGAIASLRTFGLDQEADQIVREMSLAAEEHRRQKAQVIEEAEVLESDPPNIRITHYPELQRKRRHSTSSTHAPDEMQEPKYASGSSNSTTRSIPTGSSRSSESRRVIAPEAVKHLIPEQLAGMVYDKTRKVWVKQKAPNPDRSDETEDDPFDDIPDLTVDEMEEMARLSPIKPDAPHTLDSDEESEFSTRDYAFESMLPVSSHRSSEEDVEDVESIMKQTYSSRLSEQASSVADNDVAGDSAANEAEEDIDDEISIDEGRVVSKSRGVRNIAITFSSPIASIIDDIDYKKSFESSNFSSNSQDEDEELEDDNNHRRPSSSRSNKAKMFTQNTPSRRITIGGQSFPSRPISRIDEVDEDVGAHIAAEFSRRSVSLVITPMSSKSHRSMVSLVPQSSPAQPTPTFNSLLNLTPLSEFTVHQKDPSLVLEASYAGPAPLNSHRQGTKCLDLSVKELVKQLQDVEPHEPFWEFIRQLDLRDRELPNLHMLNEFCARLEELDVSHNKIDQLNGAPSSIRSLAISHNILSDLTSWAHLSNLQYIDVSHNGLTSLRGFKDLYHLRSLKAEHNQITSLDGVMQLDGLLSLKLRGNLIERANFANSELQRLTDLDLRGNRLQEVRCLRELVSLSSLCLEDNQLASFALEDGGRFTSLRYLKLSGNQLQKIDVSQFSSLRLLYLDRNRLSTVDGLLKTKYLDSLSLREQEADLDISFLDSACEVRKLFLSGNRISQFHPKADFLNLQYLEMANCGLESLPIDFGQIFCNLRVLNLNYNALKDISPLYGIIRLKKLLLAGNRLVTIHSTADILRQIPNLSRLDLRNNPLTIGFYPAVIEQRIVRMGGNEDSEEITQDRFTLPPADKDRDCAYASRLDMATRVKRRLYEMMLSSCKGLRILDGLTMTSERLLMRDEVYEVLEKTGVIDALKAEKMDDEMKEGS